jgi:hypothetical protein
LRAVIDGLSSRRLQDQEVRVVRERPEVDRPEHAADAHRVVVCVPVGIGVRIADVHLARARDVAREHHEVPHGLAADVVGLLIRRALARRAVQERGRQAGDDRQPAAQRRAQQGRVEVAELDLAPELEETGIGQARVAQLRVLLELRLSQQAVGDARGPAREPARIEDLDVPGHDARLVTASERVVGEMHRQRAAVPVARDLRRRVGKSVCSPK